MKNGFIDLKSRLPCGENLDLGNMLACETERKYERRSSEK
jgi:hypothetical protein